jgi:hypothetical protein
MSNPKRNHILMLRDHLSHWDCELIRDYVLVPAHFDVTIIESKLAALNLAPDQILDLVYVAGCCIEWLSGFDFLAKLKAGHPSVACIYASGAPFTNFEKETSAALGIACLPKPFTPESFKALFTPTLNNGQQIRVEELQQILKEFLR